MTNLILCQCYDESILIILILVDETIVSIKLWIPSHKEGGKLGCPQSSQQSYSVWHTDGLAWGDSIFIKFNF